MWWAAKQVHDREKSREKCINIHTDGACGENEKFTAVIKLREKNTASKCPKKWTAKTSEHEKWKRITFADWVLLSESHGSWLRERKSLGKRCRARWAEFRQDVWKACCRCFSVGISQRVMNEWRIRDVTVDAWDCVLMWFDGASSSSSLVNWAWQMNLLFRGVVKGKHGFREGEWKIWVWVRVVWIRDGVELDLMEGIMRYF